MKFTSVIIRLVRNVVSVELSQSITSILLEIADRGGVLQAELFFGIFCPFELCVFGILFAYTLNIRFICFGLCNCFCFLLLVICLLYHRVWCWDLGMYTSCDTIIAQL